jgi:protoheme IX farnesyltransferase
MAAAAGFFLAARGHINIVLLFWTLLGIAIIIASACVYNNYIDRGIDKKMKRTQKRALVTGEISGRSALIFATILGILGFGILILFTNWVTVLAGIIGGIDYLLLYGIGKRTSVHGTLIGSISGAMPPVAGYGAVVGRLDIAMVLLFLIWVCWQMVHFYAIAIYRGKDYEAASIPVLPVKKGLTNTKIQMVFYAVLFMIANSLLTVFHFAGFVYLVGITLLGIFWLVYAIKGFFVADSIKWARKIFFYSLIIMLVMCVLLSVGSVLP